MAARIKWGRLTRAQRQRAITANVAEIVSYGGELDLETMKERVFELMYNDGYFDTWRKKKRDVDGFYNHWNHEWITPYIDRLLTSRIEVAKSIGSLKGSGTNLTVAGSTQITVSGINGNSSSSSGARDTLDDLKTESGSNTIWIILGCIALLGVLLILKKRKS